jgi:hypothetical protein
VLVGSGRDLLIRSAATWLLLAGASGACTSNLPSSLDGKECDAESRCLSGFVCDSGSNRCVRPTELGATDGSSGAGSLDSRGEPDDLDIGHSEGRQVIQGDPIGSGATASGGARAGLTPDDRDGGAPIDAAQSGGGNDQTMPDGGEECSQALLYPDGDGDGVGLTSGAELRCAMPGWVSTPGDCRDDLSDVFLGQSRYFGMSYPEPSHADGVSFDFDCDGTEEPDPTNMTLAPVPDCRGLSVTCNEQGYLPVDPGRSGSGIDPRCGSNLLRQCVPSQLLGCVAEVLVLSDDARFRCR